MEVYILDSLLRRDQVVDTFESLIWTERYAQWGDFELLLPSTRQTREQFYMGAMLAVNASSRVMLVETVEDSTNDGNRMLKVKGRSLETLLEDRVAKNTMGNLVEDPEWIHTGLPAAIARNMFYEICVRGDLNPYDVIPYISMDNYGTVSNWPEPSTAITYIQKPASLYEAIVELCKIYELGFRLVRDPNLTKLYFNIYTGSNRTSRQTTLDPVIFSSTHDNIKDTAELRTNVGAKNVAYVFSEFGTTTVYAPGVPADVSGFDRRVILVDANDIDEGTPDVQGALFQAGVVALSEKKVFAGLEGELTQSNPYIYGTHYNLGDIVDLQSDDGVTVYKRVTEQIFVHDGSGERMYPTLSMDQFVASNTWFSQPTAREWTDFGSTEYWGTM